MGDGMVCLRSPNQPQATTVRMLIITAKQNGPYNKTTSHLAPRLALVPTHDSRCCPIVSCWFVNRMRIYSGLGFTNSASYPI